MKHLEHYRDERDASGERTSLAVAVRAMAPGRWYDCDCGESACSLCLAWVALCEVVRQRDEAREKLAKVRELLAMNPGCHIECERHRGQYDYACTLCRIVDVVGA